MELIGRETEQDILRRCLNSSRSEFVAVYGRRRVGKTYLIRETLSSEFAFSASGVLSEEGGMAVQLESFNDEIVEAGGTDLPRAKTWREAFRNLRGLLERIPQKKKKVVFLDEIPWMSTHKSGFLPALEDVWNQWASARTDVLLIICGSATSWIVDNIIDNRGGLHNRLTRQILLAPFTLKECEEFYREAGFAMTRYQMVEAYMVFGGIPYYLDLMDPRFELYHNIDQMYFEEGAPLRNEFYNLFHALFGKSGDHLLIVEALASRAKGLSRADIVKTSGLVDGGRITRTLQDLKQSGFIREYRAFGKERQNRLYQLVDAFVLFHLRFQKQRELYNTNYWLQFSMTPGHNAWSGYAFEQVCLLHVEQIKQKLGIAGVLTEISSWRSTTAEPAAQIDLVVDRADKVINLCEIKFASGEYTIDKAESMSLRNKLTAFAAETKTRKALRVTMITTFGLKQNEYASEIPSQITLDDLFA
ncbi:MAG: ATP-binding protein [Coriobacteriales bacterium]|jgi:hypothetical protein|nr:ATP-binding protein [Coriobacteriales bacterium]